MHLSSYFKTISRFLWIATICLFGASCDPVSMAGAIGAIHEHGPKGGYADTSAGLNYCTSECKSDFKGCMESADGDKSEEQECEVDRSKCGKNCSDWAVEDNQGLMGGFKFFPKVGSGYHGGTEDTFDNTGEYHPPSSKEMQILTHCYSICFDTYHACINSDDENNSSESQCETEKQTCSQECERGEGE